MSGRPALFLDRDGTLIREREYLADPAGVELLPGVAHALRRFAAAGYALVVVTNQSGIARGLLTAEQFEAVQRQVEADLAAEDVRLDGVYHCPHHPAYTGECACRKPAPALYAEAAASLGLDLASSIFVGDRVSDVLPAAHFGGRGYLVLTGYGKGEAPRLPDGFGIVQDLAELASREGVQAG